MSPCSVGMVQASALVGLPGGQCSLHTAARHQVGSLDVMLAPGAVTYADLRTGGSAACEAPKASAATLAWHSRRHQRCGGHEVSRGPQLAYPPQLRPCAHASMLIRSEAGRPAQCRVANMRGQMLACHSCALCP